MGPARRSLFTMGPARRSLFASRRSCLLLGRFRNRPISSSHILLQQSRVAATNLHCFSTSRSTTDSNVNVLSIAENTSLESGEPSKSQGPNIWDVHPSDLATIDNLQTLIGFVEQLDSIPTLMRVDVDLIIKPLILQIKRCRLDDLKLPAELIERVIVSCLKRLPVDAAKRSEDMPYPTLELYNLAITAWGNVKTPVAAVRANKLFDLIIAEHEIDPERSVAPDRNLYKALVRAWALSDPINESVSGGPKRAQAILTEMEDVSGVTDMLRDNDILNAGLLEGFKASRNGHRNERPQVKRSFTIQPPDRMTYHLVMGAYERAFVAERPVALTRIKRIAERMDRLRAITEESEYEYDGQTYTYLLSAYLKFARHTIGDVTPAISFEVNNLLNRAYDEHKLGEIGRVCRLGWAYGVLVDCLLASKQLKESLPQAHMYALAISRGTSTDDLPVPKGGFALELGVLRRIIEAWEKSKLPEASDRIQELVSMCARSMDEQEYFRIEDLERVMDEFLLSEFYLAAEVVDLLLTESWNRWLDGRSQVKPTSKTFAIAMKAWRLVENPNKVELLYENMARIFVERADSDFQPRDIHVRYLAQSWMRKCELGQRFRGVSGHLYPAEHIERLVLQNAEWIVNVSGIYSLAVRAWSYQVVEDDADGPDPLSHTNDLLNLIAERLRTDKLHSYPCNWALAVCARNFTSQDDKMVAYHFGVDIFRRIRERNARSYVLMMQVVKSQVGDLSEEHLENISSLFEECRSRGLLTQDLIWEFFEVATIKMLVAMFGVSYSYADILISWRSKNQCLEGATFVWKGDLPSALTVEKLPSDWSWNARWGKKTDKNEQA
jgi:hypothetical protein